MEQINFAIKILKNYLKFNENDWQDFEHRLTPLERNLLHIINGNDNVSDEQAAEILFRTDFKDPNYQRHRKSLFDKLSLTILRFNPANRRTKQGIRSLPSKRLITNANNCI